MDDPAVMRRVMDPRTGLEHVLRRVILPAVRESYEDTLAATEGADLLVSHPICFAAGLVAEVTGTPWASTMVTPLGLASAHDPPTLSGYTGLCRAVRPLGPAFWGPLRRLLERATRPWAAADRPPAGRPRAAARRGPPAGRWPLPRFAPGPVLEEPVVRAAGLASADGHHRIPLLRPGRRGRAPAGPGPVPRRRAAAGRLHPRLFGVHRRRAILPDSAEAAARLGRRAVLVLKTRNRPPALPRA